jgi:predicted phosphodiesterase
LANEQSTGKLSETVPSGFIMKIVWLTDVHLEWLNQKSRRSFFAAIAEERPECILVGGDICNPEDLESWLLKLQKKVPVPIYFVLGNHDYYGASICEVRESARRITKDHDEIWWLPATGAVAFSDDVGLVGHGCWGDGGAGSFFNSPLSLNDFRYIKELSGLSKQGQLEQIRQLGAEAADYLAKYLAEAATRFGKVIVLTHVPPFPEACLYLGKPSEEGLPFFCAQAAGDALKAVAANNPETQFLVLSGHTHDAADVQVAENLRSIVADAEYGRPTCRIIELPDMFDI